MEPIPLSERKVLRRMIVDAILSTDMAVHKELLARVERRADGMTNSDEDRQLLVTFLLHVADLCTPVLPRAIRYWLTALTVSTDPLTHWLSMDPSLVRCCALTAGICAADVTILCAVERCAGDDLCAYAADCPGRQPTHRGQPGARVRAPSGAGARRGSSGRPLHCPCPD